MAIDLRANITCALGEVISGSISDSYIQGSGLVLTTGNVIINGLITPSVGDPVIFSYEKDGVNRQIPKKLRVLSSFADPFRGTTSVELGCKLTYLSDLKDRIDWDAFDDDENAEYSDEDQRIITIPIHASSVMSECLAKLGIGGTIPLTNKFSIPKFDFSPGYVEILGNLLISESYFGYLDQTETLQVKSLSAVGAGGKGPVYTKNEIIDIGSIGSGALPGKAVTVSYSTLKLKNPEEEEEEGEEKEEKIKELNWERQEVIGPKTFISIQYTKPANPENILYTTWSYIPRTVSETEYDNWDRVTRRVTTTYMIGAAVITQYYVDCWTGGATYVGFYENSAQQSVDTETMEYVLKITDPEEKKPETGYEDVLKITRTKSEPQMAIAGSIAASFVEEDGTMVSYMPLYGSTITEISVTTYETGFTAFKGSIVPVTKTFVSKSMAYGYTQQGQQEIARQLEAKTTTTTTAITNAMKLVPAGVEVTINSGRGVGLQERPAAADRTNAENADGGDPNNGWRTESEAELELATGNFEAGLRIELSMPYAPDDTFSGPPGGPFFATPSDAPSKAMSYGRAQNRLLLGNRNGMNVQISAERMPAEPFSPIYVQVNGYTVQYRTNGTQWAFDSNGIICSTDALLWGVVGAEAGAGDGWVPIAPGVSSLPGAPNVVDTSPNQYIGSVETVGNDPQTALSGAFPSSISGDGVLDYSSGDVWVYNGTIWENAGTTPGPTIESITSLVLPYGEIAIYEGRLRLGNVVTKFDYSLQLLTVVPPIPLKVKAAVFRAIAGNAGVYVLNGQATNLKRNYYMNATGGSFALDPQAVTLRPPSLFAEAAAYSMSGQQAPLTRPGGDPYWSAVKLLLHLDGVNNGTTFIDSSPVGRTMTRIGNIVISTAQSKFGGASGFWDGTGDSVQAADSDDWNIGAQDFTIEAWIRPSITGSRPILSQRASNTTGYAFDVYASSSALSFGYSLDGTNANLAQVPWSITTNTWTHFAICRSGTDLRFFQNGTLIPNSQGFLTTTITGAIFNSTAVLNVGQFGGSTSSWSGYIDELRFTRAARYTSSFSVQTAAFPEYAQSV